MLTMTYKHGMIKIVLSYLLCICRRVSRKYERYHPHRSHGEDLSGFLQVGMSLTWGQNENGYKCVNTDVYH